MNQISSEIPPYQIQALNDALTSENKIHSDVIAQKFGFTGALVSGVSVFGHMTHPLVKAYGEEWLSSTIAEVKFIKPAYVDDRLTIENESIVDTDKPRHHLTTVYNQAKELLASMESWQPDQDLQAKQYPHASHKMNAGTREEISFDRIQLDQFAPEYDLCLTADQHSQSLNIMRDELGLYHRRQSPWVHPYFLLKQCNKALMRMFILPAWIHVGSRMIIHRRITVGETVNVQTIPTNKWENKGHQFVTLDIIFSVSGQVAWEVEHTAIFRLSEA